MIPDDKATAAPRLVPGPDGHGEYSADGFMVVIRRWESENQVTLFAAEADALDYFGRAGAQWSDSFLCRVIFGPRDAHYAAASGTGPQAPSASAVPATQMGAAAPRSFTICDHVHHGADWDSPSNSWALPPCKPTAGPPAVPALPSGARQQELLLALRAARSVINRDRTGLAAGLNAIRAVVQGWSWLARDEWASYSWEERTEKTLRKEIGAAFDSITKTLDDALHASGSLATESCREIDRVLRDLDARAASAASPDASAEERARELAPGVRKQLAIATAIRAAESAAYARGLADAQRIGHEECVAAMGAAPSYAQVGYRIEYRLLALAKAEGRSDPKGPPDPAPLEGKE